MRKYWIAVVTILIMVICSSALASTLIIPAGTKNIEEEAFYGDTSLDEVVLPEGVEEIGERAFGDSSLQKINLPDTLTDIADNAIDTGVSVSANLWTQS